MSTTCTESGRAGRDTSPTAVSVPLHNPRSGMRDSQSLQRLEYWPWQSESLVRWFWKREWNPHWRSPQRSHCWIVWSIREGPVDSQLSLTQLLNNVILGPRARTRWIASETAPAPPATERPCRVACRSCARHLAAGRPRGRRRKEERVDGR